MSALFFTDPHFHAYPAFARHDPVLGYSSRVKEGVDTMDWLVSLAEEHEVDSVVCLGDVFHVPGFLDPIVTYEIVRRFQKFVDDDRQLVTVGGNHDAAGSQHSAIALLPGERMWGGSGPIFIDGFGEAVFCVPWTRNLDPVGDYKASGVKTPLLMGHWMCHDVEVSTGHRVHGIEGVSQEWLDQFDAVLLGDAHKRQTIGNTEYLGSCLKHTFNDDGETAYAYIVEKTSGGKGISLTPIPNPHSPYFLRLSTSIRPIGELMDWIEETVAKADPNGARVYLDLQATPKEAAKVTKRFAKTTLHIRVRPMVEANTEEKPAARIQTTSAAGPTDIIRQYVAAKGGDTPSEPDALVRKGEEYIG